MCRRSIRAAVGPAAGGATQQRARRVPAQMTYQVMARKYRPQTFGDVVGQRGVTQTLRNALARGRLAQAFVFAGPRGVGKTTTARILARALNCIEGPTPEPCGTCDACREIAEGRDIDVLEIDAATHTQVENVREVIIAGLAMAPVRNRYKVYIIDEVHQLSGHSFNALLKSIEEPPPHAVFMMATTELGKIPDTILSRSQVYEFRTIGRQAIADQLAKIAAAESIAISAEALGVIARAADGSMRDAQSAFDQIIAFAGETIGVDDVAAVLGLIGREPVLDAIAAVADETPGLVFDLAGRFVEAGYDLRAVCRELVRAVRDLMALSIDPERVNDPEIAGDGERDRLAALAARFSREDLLRGFDVIVRAELEMRGAAQPRFHFEMALLRWMHLRNLVPLTELLAGTSRLTPTAAVPARASAGETSGTGTPAAPDKTTAAGAPASATLLAPAAGPLPSAEPAAPAAPQAPPSATPPAPAASAGPTRAAGRAGGTEDEKAAVLAGIKKAKRFFYGTVVAQAQRITLRDDRLEFTFTPAQRTLARQVEQHRTWIETLAAQEVGRPVAVTATTGPGAAEAPATAGTVDRPPNTEDAGGEADPWRERAMKDSVIKTMLDVLPAEIDSVEKL